jgi:hypothetical protein
VLGEVPVVSVVLGVVLGVVPGSVLGVVPGSVLGVVSVPVPLSIIVVSAVPPIPWLVLLVVQEDEKARNPIANTATALAAWFMIFFSFSFITNRFRLRVKSSFTFNNVPLRSAYVFVTNFLNQLAKYRVSLKGLHFKV